MSREDAFGRRVVQAFMVPPCVVMGDKIFKLPLKITRQIVIFEQDAILECAMSAFDLALGLGMIGRAAGMRDVIVFQPLL